MSSLSKLSIGILGLGLIGGSLARSLRYKLPNIKIRAYDLNAVNLEAALADGAINDFDDLEGVVKVSDVVVLALPPLSNIDMIKKLSEIVGENSIVTDVSSVKTAIRAAVELAPEPFQRNFVLGHPIAGSERSGYGAASHNLFDGRSVILTPHSSTSTFAVGIVHELWRSIGANVIGMSPDEHDSILASTSHLPHLLAYALVNVLIGQKKSDDIFRYAAGGFADFSRLASSDPTMWSEIFLTNANETEVMLDAFIDQLMGYKSLLSEKNHQALAINFKAAKTAREHFMEKHYNPQNSLNSASRSTNYVVNPSGRISGTISVPGDKSISHRAIILGSIADGVTKITGFLEGEDTLCTLKAFCEMGVTIVGPNNGVVIVYGVGIDGLKAPRIPLYMGNSGTAMRLIAGVLSAQSFDSELIGDESLSNRPMQRICDPLSEFGARIKLTKGNFPPLYISGMSLHGVRHEMTIASAQIKSCLLLAGINASGITKITEPAPCRDHTERMLEGFGYPIERRQAEGELIISGGGRLTATDIEVPGDISSAAFFMVAAAISKNSEIHLKQVGLNPTRTGIISLLKLMNAELQISNERVVGGESVGDITIASSELSGISVPVELVPLAIDEFPIFCIAAACAKGSTTIKGASELRVKESDRIKAMADGLTALGITLKTFDDGLQIKGGNLLGGNVKSFSDHRIAMAFTIAGVRASGPISIEDCVNVGTSFPGFVGLARSIGIDVRET